MPDPDAIREQVTAAIDAQRGGAGGYELTPPLPTHWPPAGRSVVAYFAYTGHALPTGVAKTSVNSPDFRAEVDLANPTTQPMITAMHSRPLANTQSARSDPTATPQAERLLLQTVKSGAAPEAAVAEQIRQGYAAWAIRHLGLVEELRPVLSEFLNWIFPPRS